MLLLVVRVSEHEFVFGLSLVLDDECDHLASVNLRETDRIREARHHVPHPPIDPSGPDTDQHLVIADRGPADLPKFKTIGGAVAVMGNCFHGYPTSLWSLRNGAQIRWNRVAASDEGAEPCEDQGERPPHETFPRT
jgi:hypothetical protein